MFSICVLYAELFSFSIHYNISAKADEYKSAQPTLSFNNRFGDYYLTVLSSNGFTPLFSQISLRPTFGQKASCFFGESAKTQNIVVYRLTYP
jgi:hypothetical protein